ncbi:MAG: hypothetical protein WD940_01635, partial [Patescibacteria group bacterium]
VILNRPLLNQILVEEGMDPAEAERIVIRFPHSQERTRRHNLWDFLLLGGSSAGSWIEEQRTALIYYDQHRYIEGLSETLAHELGHAFDHSTATYARKVKWLWRIYLALVVIAVPLITRWHGTFGHDLPLVVRFWGGFLTWSVLALSLACGNWSLIRHRIYRPDPGEKAARAWTERLTAREDWGEVLSLKERG